MARKKIYEDAMDYGDDPSRMASDIERKFATRQTPFSDSPGFPSGTEQSSFEELLASERFKEVVEKIQRYLGMPSVGPGDLQSLMSTVYSAVNTLSRIETANKAELERLAEKVVREELGVTEDQVQYDAKLVSFGQVSNEGIQGVGQKPDEEEIQQQFGVKPEQAEQDIEDLMSAFEKYDAEVAKRHYINALIQGASKKGHYMFELLSPELNNIDPQLTNLYGVLMSILDATYWLIPDQMMQAASAGGGGGAMAGTEEYDPETTPPTVKARAAFFPVLIHEMIKGTYELMASRGFTGSAEQAELVMSETDSLVNEAWQIRIGPVLWQRLKSSFPMEVFEDNARWIQNYIFNRFVQLDAEEFFRVAKLINSKDPKGKQIIERMVKDIKEYLYNKEQGDDEDEDYGYDDDDSPTPPDSDLPSDDEFDDFLKSLGISRSED
jgi:hypothetical protein